MFGKRFGLMIWLGVALVLSSCKIELPEKVTVETTPGGASFSCTATPALSGNVDAGFPLAVMVKAIGGSAPYSIPGVIGNFASFTNVTRTYANNTNNSIVVNDQFTVADSTGALATCSFAVTVKPENNPPPSSVTCAMTASNENPTVNSEVTYTMTAANGDVPYDFSNFAGGDNVVIVSPMIKISSTQARATVRYTTSGAKSASAIVTDHTNDQASCNKSITVRSNPSMTVAASPSSVVEVGQTITLTASVANFVSTPTVTFTTSEPNIQISPSGLTATVRATDTSAHTFTVRVRATQGSDVVTVDVPLQFTAQLPLNCSITHPVSTYYVGDTVTFTINSTPNEPLEVTQITIQDGTVISSPSANPIRAQFNSAGTKTISVKARSTTSGRVCNSGNFVTDTVFINATQTLNCSAQTYYNPSYVGEFFTGYVYPNQNSSFVRIERIDSNVPITGGYDVLADKTSARMIVYNAGTFTFTFYIRDTLTNQTANCSTQHTVWR